VDEILGNLRKAILEYDRSSTESWARKAIDQGVEPLKAMEVLTGAIREVGDRFGKGELWLPDLVGAAGAMQAAMPVIEEQIKRRGETHQSLGHVVIGTVWGDIHNIGKDMVATLLFAEGFEIIDLGVNVKAEKFAEAINEHQAEILAMSALMTTTAYEQEKVIELLKKEGLRDKVKIMVGGGAITQEFATKIGADGYSPTASGGAVLARRLLGIK